MDIISKDLQEDIARAQNELKNAIRDHQMCVGRLKNDPNNANILDGIRDIQLLIINLGRWQNKLIQRLRTEVDIYQAANPVKGARLALTSLLGLTNNNHITRNKESTTSRRLSSDKTDQSKPLLNGHADSRSSPKEDYEEVVRNGDVDASPLRRQDDSVKDRRSSSIEPASAEDDVMELDSAATKLEENGESEKPKLKEQQHFLESLGLITNDRLIEVQKKRSERKRRSTASSHYLYKNWEMPTKRRRHAYLQSLGSAPQTRQTTARLNGPSPPPKPYNKPGPKPGAAAAARSLIAAANKPGPKPAIMRNGEGTSKDFFGGKVIMQETDKNSGSSSSSCSSNGRDNEQKKVSQQTTSTGKALHIPGLPSGLTIERIENDSSVCITCRNPGTLTVCEYCSAKFHVSCHTTSPGSASYCPKCVTLFLANVELLLEKKSINKEKETAAAAYTARAYRSTGTGIEVHKSPGRFFGTAATGRHKLLTAASLGLNQLPSSTFLIPIAATSSSSNDSGGIVSVAAIDKSLIVSSSPSFLQGPVTGGSRLEFAIEQQKQTSILLNQLSQPSITTINGKGESSIRRSSQDIAAGQSLLLVDKVARQSVGKRRWSADRSSSKSRPGISVLDHKWSKRSSTDTESKSKSGFPVTKSPNYVTVEVICQEEDDKPKTRNENSSDYVYIELEPTETKPNQEQEPEVFNISSGSSELQAIDQPDQLSTIEHLETVSKSFTSTESVSTDDRDQQQQEDSTSDENSANNSTTSCHNDSDNFLNTVFPGRYGYKIDIVDLDSSSSELNESLENPPIEPKITSQPESQSEQSEHVKLEEAHLSAPLRTKLVEETIVEKTIDEPLVEEKMIEKTSVEENMDEETKIEKSPAEVTLVEEAPVNDNVVEESSLKESLIEEATVTEKSVEKISEHLEESQQLTTVLDNKSDDAEKIREQDDQISDNEEEKHVTEDVVQSLLRTPNPLSL